MLALWELQHDVATFLISFSLIHITTLYFVPISSSFVCDFALTALLKLNANIPGSDTELHIMEGWGRNVVKACVSHHILFPIFL